MIIIIEYRQINIEESEQLTNLIKKIADESNFYPFTSQDYNVDSDEQKIFIKKMIYEKNCYIQGAFENGLIIGVIYLYGGSRLRNYHSTTLGIGVLEEYSNQKVGTNLLKNAIKYAYDSDVIGKINVQVIKENKKAINFYKKHNFEIEGIEKRSLFIESEFFDTINLGLIIQ